MNWYDLPYIDKPEIIDNPAYSSDDLEASMLDVAKTNAYFGGTHAIRNQVARVCESVPRDVTLRLLDIGSGTGDIPRAIAAWATAQGRSIEIVAVDNLVSMLLTASRKSLHVPSISFLSADAGRLPFRNEAFHVTTCALAFHHFGHQLGATVLREMDRVSSVGFVVSDLHRDRFTLAAVAAGMLLIRAQPITRHDSRASVFRSFTRRDMAKIVAASGVRGIRVHSHWHIRTLLTKRKHIA